MTTSRSPELVEVLRAAIDSRLQEVNTALPGQIDTYDALTQKASVKPLLKNTIQLDDGSELTEDLPIITDVPVAFPRSTNFKVTFPLKKGDYVLLVFNQRSIDQYMQKGSDTDPVDFRMHQLADAVAYPGFYPTTATLKKSDADDMVLGHDINTAVIHLKEDGTIHLAAKEAADAMALASKVEADFQAVVDAITNAVPLPQDGGAQLQAQIVAALSSAGVPNPVGSEIVKAD